MGMCGQNISGVLSRIFWNPLANILESSRILWNPLEYSGILSNIVESSRIFWKPPEEFQRVIWTLRNWSG
eukprot:1146924-Amorphochlora_amoeboformis.AAC.1